jgi:4-amino-4-deoxy-L-arabinose transferase-like glycosyltransferase
MVKKTGWSLLAALALLLIVLRLPSFEMPLDPDSSANAFFARQMHRGETLYDKFHPAHHLPGIYYTFELAFNLFGDHPNSPKLLLFPWALACAWLIYLMGRSLFDTFTGITGAVFFILVSSQIWVTGMTVQMEHFANLPMIGSVFIALVLLRNQAPAWKFIWVGLLGVVSLLYKLTFVAPLVVTGIAILLTAWITRAEAGVWKMMFARLIWMAVGLMIPLAVVASYFAMQGLWERLLLVFELGFTYVNDTQLMVGSDMPSLFWLSVNNIVLLLFGLIAAYRLARRSLPIRNMDDVTDFGLVLWLFITLALAGMRGGGFAHYVLPVIPPLALLGAVEVSLAYRRWNTTAQKHAMLGAGIFIALVVANFLWANRGIYSHYLNYKFGESSHEDFLQNVSEDGYASQEVAEYIEAHTTPDDFVYIWSIYVDVYYYADRSPPIDILWPSYVGATGSPDRIFDPRTKYIVLDTPERLPRPQWLVDGLASDYHLEVIIEGREIYRRLS